MNDTVFDPTGLYVPAYERDDANARATVAEDRARELDARLYLAHHKIAELEQELSTSRATLALRTEQWRRAIDLGGDLWDERDKGRKSAARWKRAAKQYRESSYGGVRDLGGLVAEHVDVVRALSRRAESAEARCKALVGMLRYLDEYTLCPVCACTARGKKHLYGCLLAALLGEDA